MPIVFFNVVPCPPRGLCFAEPERGGLQVGGRTSRLAREPLRARRTGPMAPRGPQGIPFAKFDRSIDMSTVVPSKRRPQCREV